MPDKPDKPAASPGVAPLPASPAAPASAPEPEPEVEFTPSPVLERQIEEAPMGGPKCPQCGGPTKAYEGTNPHKQGSYECPKCQLRVREA
jgi:hypothetical protein